MEAIQNRDLSYMNLDLSKRMKETYIVIQEWGPLTPQQSLKYFNDNRPINTVQSRFTDLYDRGYIIPTMSYTNEKTGQSNTVYRVMTLKERMDFSIQKGQEWTERIAELETDHLQSISKSTKKWIRNEIKKLKQKLKNLVS